MREYNGIINISEPDDDYSLYMIYSSDPEDKSVYIGVTNNSKLRAQKHGLERGYKRGINNPLYIWMNDLIVNKQGGKVIFKVIETELNKEIAFIKEEECIIKYKESGHVILNTSVGGKGPKGVVPWNKGKNNHLSLLQIKNMSVAHLGNNMTGMKGKTHSASTKVLLVTKNKERKERGWKSPKSKKVYKFDKDNNFLTEYSSLSEAAKEENVSPTSVGEWCRGEKRSKKGNIFSYKNN